MANNELQKLPSVKTIVEKMPDGLYNVWLKYENVSNQFISKMRGMIESEICEVTIENTVSRPIDVPKDDEEKLIETLVETVKMLDSNAALAFIKANKDRTDAIGYLPLLWAAARCSGIPDESVENNLRACPGQEKAMYESLLPRFQHLL